jgi:DNA-binding MarR family transcriptional regulator
MTVSRDTLTTEALSQLDALMSLRRQAFCAQPLYREVSLPQLHVLITLREQGAMTVTELATVLGISAPSASSIVDRMAEHDLVERIRDETDRRVVHVRLSPRGQTVIEELVGLKREQLHRILAAMTEEELATVVAAMQAVRRALERARAPASPPAVPLRGRSRPT